MNVILFGKGVFVDVIKLWISARDHPGLPRSVLNPMTNVFRRETQRKRPCKGRGRDWSYVAISHGPPGRIRRLQALENFPLEPLEGVHLLTP